MCSVFIVIEELDRVEGELIDDIIAGVAIVGNRYDIEEPLSYKEAISCRKVDERKEKMNEE